MPQLLTLVFSDRPGARRFWRIALVLLLGAVMWLALSPAPPKMANLGWDKLNHAAAFAALSCVAGLGFARAYLRVAAALLGFGALIEMLQSLTPTRAAEWGDLLADAVGISVGLLLLALITRWLAPAAKSSSTRNP